MNKSDAVRTIDVFILKTKSEVALKSISNFDNTVVNGSKIIKLDLNIDLQLETFFGNLRSSAIDFSTIVTVNLSHCSLNCFPDGFAIFSLKHLDLSYNNFVNVPDCILKGLASLEILNLSHNALTSFVDEPKCIKKLRILKINNNNLLNVPNWILTVKCFNLEELDYSNNDVISLSSAEFLRKPSYELKRLELRNSSIRGEDMQYLKMIRPLQYLDLSNDIHNKNRNNMFTCDHLETLFNNSRFDDQLRVLNLNNMHIAFLPEEVSQLTVLQELHLNRNNMMWLPQAVMSLKQLHILDVSYNKLISLPDFSKLQKLEVIKACHNIISNIEGFSNSLRVLDLYNNNLESDCLTKINNAILELDLDENFFDVNIDKYGEKKTALRENLYESEPRNDVPKVQLVEKDDIDTATSDSEESFVQLIECNNHNEELWEELYDANLDCDSCDNGCTLSDNEWTGNETPPIATFKNTVEEKLTKSFPDWVFEDVC